ncbi:hypothetical protein BTVI_145178 [Pitangus sulphuratus]|nr:hypothetical protein BTVI_145178 [Pitangus sulphuratus]
MEQRSRVSNEKENTKKFHKIGKSQFEKGCSASAVALYIDPWVTTMTCDRVTRRLYPADLCSSQPVQRGEQCYGDRRSRRLGSAGSGSFSQHNRTDVDMVGMLLGR